MLFVFLESSEEVWHRYDEGVYARTSELILKNDLLLKFCVGLCIKRYIYMHKTNDSTLNYQIKTQSTKSAVCICCWT